MDNKPQLNIEKINIDSFCSALFPINQELVSIIQDWGPPQDFKIYSAKYFYGTNILSHGKLQLPLTNGMTIDFDDLSIDEEIRANLSYSSFPIGIIINNTAEVYVELEARLIPLALFGVGIPLGLLETIEAECSFCFRNVWTVSAGARTAFMLPKISDKTYHAKIQREFNCSSVAPQAPYEHVPVFVDIMKKMPEYQNWYVEVLFFTTPWFNKDVSNPHWVRFHHYLQQYLISYSGFTRNKATFDLIWDYFTQALIKKKKRVPLHIFEKMKNLIIGALGVTPLFSPANNDTRGPFTTIQRIYRDVYGINYAPVIMVPKHFNVEIDSVPAYFSLKHHSTFEVNPKNKSQESLITDLVQLNSLVNYFFELVSQGQLKLETTLIEKILKSIELNFYHCGAKDYTNIKDTQLLPLSDKNLCTQLGSTELMDFPYTNFFLRSCVQVNKKI